MSEATGVLMHVEGGAWDSARYSETAYQGLLGG